MAASAARWGSTSCHQAGEREAWCYAGFPYPARTRQCEQAYLLPTQQMLDSLHFLLASNQYSGLDRQVVGVGVQGLERREIGRQVRND